MSIKERIEKYPTLMYMYDPFVLYNKILEQVAKACRGNKIHTTKIIALEDRLSIIFQNIDDSDSSKFKEVKTHTDLLNLLSSDTKISDFIQKPRHAIIDFFRRIFAKIGIGVKNRKTASYNTFTSILSKHECKDAPIGLQNNQ